MWIGNAEQLFFVGNHLSLQDTATCCSANTLCTLDKYFDIGVQLTVRKSSLHLFPRCLTHFFRTVENLCGLSQKLTILLGDLFFVLSSLPSADATDLANCLFDLIEQMLTLLCDVIGFRRHSVPLNDLAQVTDNQRTLHWIMYVGFHHERIGSHFLHLFGLQSIGLTYNVVTDLFGRCGFK